MATPDFNTNLAASAAGKSRPANKASLANAFDRLADSKPDEAQIMPVVAEEPVVEEPVPKRAGPPRPPVAPMVIPAPVVVAPPVASPVDPTVAPVGVQPFINHPYVATNKRRPRGQKMADNEKKKAKMFMFDQDVLAMIDRVAYHTRDSMSGLVNDTMRAALANHPAAQKPRPGEK